MSRAGSIPAIADTGRVIHGQARARFAGHQVDARIHHRVMPFLMLEADVVILGKVRFLRDAPHATPGSWTRYLSLNVAASF